MSEGSFGELSRKSGREVRFIAAAQQCRLLGIGEVCDGYMIGALLGKGGMGEVHEGTQLAENREVVLKSLPAGWLADAEGEARLAREAELLRRLAHPGIADFVEFKVIGGKPRLVMALVEGVPLKEYLEEPRTVEDKVRLVEQVARALMHAHGRDVAHRDLKPGNVMVREDGTAVVLDFGIGALTDRGGLAVAGLTREGTVAGTPHWMAPEQAKGRCLLPKAADVYALGLLLYHGLSGELPIAPVAGESDFAYFMRVQQERPRRLREVRPSVSKSLEAICEMALRREPEARPSAQTFADDLGRWLRNEPVSARQAGTLERIWLSIRRRPDWWAAGVALVVGLSVVAVLQSRSATRESKARTLAEQALEGSMQTLSASDAAVAAESASRGAYDEALPWLARSLRRDPGNDMAAWLAGQIMGQRQSFLLRKSRKVPMSQLEGRVEFVKGSFFYRSAAGGSLVKCGLTANDEGWEIPIGQVLSNGSGAGVDFAVAADGENLAVVESKERIVLLDGRNGTVKWIHDGLPLRFNKVGFSTSGKLLLILETDRESGDTDVTMLRIISRESGQAILPDFALEGRHEIQNCITTPDDRWLVLSRAYTNSLFRISLVTGEITDLTAEWHKVSDGTCYCMRAIPGTGTVLLSGQGKGYQAGLLDVSSGKLIWAKPLGSAEYDYTVSPRGMVLSPDCTQFVMLGTEGDLMIHHISDGSPASPVIATGWRPERIFFDGETILIQGPQKSELWSPRDGFRIAVIPETPLYRDDGGNYGRIETGRVEQWELEGKVSLRGEFCPGPGKTGFDLDKKGARLIIASQNGDAQVIDLATLIPIGDRFPQRSPSLKVEVKRRMIPRPRISSNGKTSVSWLTPQSIVVRKVESEPGQTSTLIECRSDTPITSAALNPDGIILVFGCANGIWEAWHIPSHRRLHHSTILNTPPVEDDTKGDPGLILEMEFSGNGKKLAIGTEQWCTTSLWNTTDWTALQAPLMNGHGVSALCFDNETEGGFWAANWLGECKFFAPFSHYLKSDTPPMVSHPAPISDCRISPDGALLATSGWDHTAKLWDAGNREPLTPPLHHDSAVTSVGWSPDSQMIVTASVTGEVYLWDRGTRRKLYTFTQPAAVVQAAFGLKGTRLILARMDGEIVILELFQRGIACPYLPDALEKSAGFLINEQGSLVRGNSF